jgi:hypothetical protein
MKILDLSAGHRGVWFDRANPDTLFVDHCEEVGPQVVADSRQLPLRDGQYDLIVFDPPHVNFGAKSNMSKDYGHYTTATIRDTLVKTAQEAHRVARSGAMMSFKWNDHDQSFAKVLELLRPYWQPLFGARTAQRTKHSAITAWVMLQRVS